MSKKQKTNYAFIGLIVSALACVSTGMLGLVKGIIALDLFTPESQDGLNLALQISVALLVLGLASYAWIAPDRVRRFLTGRQARYGSNAFILILAFMGTLFVVNFLAFNNPHSWDWTKDKQNTLAPETVEALQKLPENITAKAFFSSQMGAASIDETRQLLENFKSSSKGKFDYEFVDPVANPLAARDLGVTGDGKIVLVMGERSEVVAFASETSILRAIVRLVNPEARTVYFLIGHGERDINSGGDTAFSRARATLEDKNYTVRNLNLAAERAVPEDARAIIIAGPLQPVTPDEVALLNKYLNGGGAVIIMEDPVPFTDFGDAEDQLAGSINRLWGINLQNNLVIDLNGNPITIAVAYQYDTSHPITQAMNNVGTYFPIARSIEITAQPQDVNASALILTTDNSWGETDFAPLREGGDGRVDFTEGADTPGPLTLAVAAENTATDARLVVFGNSTFATDQFFDSYGNGDLFVNAVDWAVGEDNPIDITPHAVTQRTFNPPGQLQWLFILLGSIFLLPGAVIASGIAAWIARRRQG